MFILQCHFSISEKKYCEDKAKTVVTLLLKNCSYHSITLIRKDNLTTVSFPQLDFLNWWDNIFILKRAPAYLCYHEGKDVDACISTNQEADDVEPSAQCQDTPEQE